MYSTDQVIDVIGLISEKIESEKEYLTDLDRPIGDSDHGINMARGFKAVCDKLPSLAGKDIGTVLKTAGMTLVSTVGGSAGPLYGTAYMNAGKYAAGKTEIGMDDLIAMIDAAIAGVQMRGKSTAGEATMLDAMVPTLEALREGQAAGKTAAEILGAAADAAMKGAESTVPMIATKGRASYVGERGIGHQDPGATSWAMTVGVIADHVKGVNA